MARHAFLIAAHDSSYVLERLMRLLDDERNDLYLHVDRKSHSFDPRTLMHLCRHSRVTIMPRRKVYWGEYSQVESALGMMRVALEEGDYSYLHLLSGSDLPLKSNDEIHRFFDGNADREFVSFYEYSSIKHERAKYWYPYYRFLRSPNRLVRALDRVGRTGSIAAQRLVRFDRTRRLGVDLKTGSDWYSISTALASHLVDSEPAIRQWFRRSFIPSEFYVQTVVWNSEFRTKVFDYDNPRQGNARLIDFARGEGSSPLTWRQEHLPELLRSEALFARKFDPEVDRGIIDSVVAHVQEAANRPRTSGDRSA